MNEPLEHIALRPATVADAAAIAAIYNHEVEHTTTTFDLVPVPWPTRKPGSPPGPAPSVQSLR